MKLLLKTTIIIIFSLSSHAQSVSERLNHLYLEVTTPEKYKNADTKNILVEVNTLLEDKELAPTQRMQALLIATNLYKLNGERSMARSEEHTSELQSRPHLVCRLLIEK